MDESRLTSLLVDATDDIAAARFDAGDDLRRGRAARRRRGTITGAAAVLGTAAALVAAFAVSGQLTPRPEPADAPAGGLPPSVTATSTSGAETIGASTTVTTAVTTTAAPTTTTPAPELPGVAAGARDFLRMVFGVAQDHLDPTHARLQWSEGFTGADGANSKEWGEKFGWQAPGERGQAMVYPGVGDLPAGDRVMGCGQYNYQGSARCTTATMSNGQQAQVLNTTTRREVHWSRPDGTYVFVIVDAVFGNNTTVATKSALPTLAQLEDFVMDPRLVLPPS
jgi:hypothetical protein